MACALAHLETLSRNASSRNVWIKSSITPLVERSGRSQIQSLAKFELSEAARNEVATLQDPTSSSTREAPACSSIFRARKCRGKYANIPASRETKARSA